MKRKKILKKMSRIPTKELIVRCDCGEDDFLTFMSWAKAWPEDYDKIDQLYVCCGAHKMWRWRDKFRVAWKILKWGEYRNWGTLVGRPDIKRIIKYLESVLVLWDRLEKNAKRKSKHSNKTKKKV